MKTSLKFAKSALNKKLVLLAFAGFAAATTNAQIQIGVKGGLNLSSYGGSYSSGTSTLVGFHLGGLVKIPLVEQFSLQPELVYSTQGAKLNSDGVSASLHDNYLNIPVMFKYTHESGFFAETGPQLGFLLSAKEKIGDNSTDRKGSFKSTDFSWDFGIGYLLKPANVGINLRYNVGLANVDNTGDNLTLRNNVFQIGIFYLFKGSR